MSVATTYAEALYEAAADAGALQPVAEGFGAFAEAYAESDELRAVLLNPGIDPSAKRGVVESLAEGAHPQVVNALRLLIDRDRIAALPEIAEAFQDRVARAEERLEVEAVTAIPLPGDLRQRIVASLQEKSGKSIALTESVDPGIVGGLVLRVGETVVDGSVRRRLEQLRRELTGASVDAAARED